jgi:MFS transporter, Spinster family, sphingosine-1-phosphate transporter
MAKPPSARMALGVLTGVNLLNYMDRYVTAGALPLILAAFHASDTQGGWLLSLFMFPYALVAPLAGNLGDKRRRFAIAGVGVLVWSAATFGSGLAPMFWVLITARIVVGVGEACYTVVTPSLLGDYYPAARRGRALAFFYAAIPVGTAIGFGVGGFVGQHLGWRWAFYLAGIPGFALALVLILFRDPPRGGVEAGPAVVPAAPPSSSLSPPGWRALASYPSYVYNVAGQTIYTFALGGMAAWMPTYFSRVRGLPLASTSLIFGGIVCLAGLVGTLLGGQLSDRLAHRAGAAAFLVSGVALVAATPFTLLALLAPSPAVFWPAMFVTLALLFMNTGPLNAAIANVLPPGLRARGFGLNTLTIHILGDAFSPFLIGLASDAVGLRIPILAAGMMLCASGLVLLMGQPALRRDLQNGRA